MTQDRAPPPSKLRAFLAGLAILAGTALLVLALLAAPSPAAPPPSFVALRPTFLWIGGLVALLGFVLLQRRGKRRALMALVALAVAAAAAEVVLRHTVGPRFAAIYRTHDVWLYEHLPGVRRVNVTPGGSGEAGVAFDLDADGFRGPGLRTDGAAKRVLVYGDSFVAAAATPREETFAERLGRELGAGAGKPVECVNAGVAGYGPDQCLLRMEAEVPRLRPDLVVLVLLAENDLGDVVRNRLFDLDAQGRLVRRRAVLAPEVKESIDAAAEGLVLRKLLRLGREHAHRLAWGPTMLESDERAEIWLQTCRIEHRIATETPDTPVRGVFEDYTDEDVRLDPRSESAQHKAALLRALLRETRDAARRLGVPLVFVIVPAAFDACDDYDVDRVPPGRFPEYRRDNLSRTMQDAAEPTGVPTVNLFVPFRGAHPETLYFRGGDTHWNSAGQELAARLVARFVEARGLLR